MWTFSQTTSFIWVYDKRFVTYSLVSENRLWSVLGNAISNVVSDGLYYLMENIPSVGFFSTKKLFLVNRRIWSIRYCGSLVTRYLILAIRGRTTSVTDSPSNFFSMLKSGTWETFARGQNPYPDKFINLAREKYTQLDRQVI